MHIVYILHYNHIYQYLNILFVVAVQLRACLNMAAIRNVMAGTEFCIADAKVGDVLSNPSK